MERGPAAVQLVTVSGGGSGGAVYSAQAHAHAHTQPPSLPSSAVVKVTTSLDGNEIRERERGMENHASLKSLFTHNLTPMKKPMLLIWISAFKDTSASRHMGADTEPIHLVLIRSGFGFNLKTDAVWFRCGLIRFFYRALRYLSIPCTVQST